MKVTTLSFIHRGKENIRFTYDVNVSKDGTFSTTLSKEVVGQIESYGVTLNKNRLGNPGYFTSNTMDGLENEIRKIVDEAVSCELVSVKDVIKYQLLICASYCRNSYDDSDTNLYPNGSKLNGHYQWINGNVRCDGLERKITSFNVFVKPISLKIYRYKSGRERIEESPIDENKYPENSAIRFINSLVNMYPLKCVDVNIMSCTERNAAFFKKAIISIWKLNELLGQFLNEGTLEQAIGQQDLLL